MRVSLGGSVTVSALEQWYNQIRAGRAFAGGVHPGSAVGQFTHCQLHNPAGSAVTVLVRAIIPFTSTSTELNLRQDNTARANDSGAGINLLSGGAASVARVRNENIAALQGSLMGPFGSVLSDKQPLFGDWMFEMGAGRGITVVTTNPNIDLGAMFWWIEL